MYKSNTDKILRALVHEVRNTMNWSPAADGIDMEETKVPNLHHKFVITSDAVESVRGHMRLPEPIIQKVMWIGHDVVYITSKAECIPEHILLP